MALGLPYRSSAVNINQNCASGMRALEVACNNLLLGKTEIALVIGEKVRLMHLICCLKQEWAIA